MSKKTLLVYKDNSITIVLSKERNTIIVPKKYIKHAVLRNLMKRRMRFLIRNFYDVTHYNYIKLIVYCMCCRRYNALEYISIIDIIHKNAVRIYKFRKDR